VGACCGLGPGGAAHRRRQGTGRKEEGSPPPELLGCGSGRREEISDSRVSRVLRPYIYHQFRRVGSQPSIWRSTAAIHRQPRGLL
jgi:hypothetical protein